MISVITPSYGQLDWLRLCAASVADQEGVAVEHIVQDAGTDGISEAEIQPAREAEGKVRLYVEKDRGMYDAINRGLRRARGEICAYLNCDEQYLPGALAQAAKFFQTHSEVDVLFGDVVLADREGNPVSYRRIVLPTISHVRFAHLNTGSCATFFRRRLLERGFYFDTRWKAIGDAVWMETLLNAGIRMAKVSEPLAVFTFTGKNLGATPLSVEETAQWRGSASRLQTIRAVLGHRLRKARAGAYRRRHVEIVVYTLTSPGARRQSARDVSFGWPTK